MKSLLDPHDHLIKLKGLWKIIVSPHPDRIDSGLNVSETSHDNHDRFGEYRKRLLKDFLPRDPGKAEVRDDHVIGVLANHFKGNLAVARFFYLVICVLEPLANDLANIRLIVYQQDSYLFSRDRGQMRSPTRGERWTLCIPWFSYLSTANRQIFDIPSARKIVLSVS